MLHLKNFLFAVFAVLFFSQSGFSEDASGGYYQLCTSCHGAEAEGQQNIEAPNLRGLSDWYLEHQLKNFKNGVRGLHPQDLPGMRMRPMARTIRTDAEIAKVAKYIAKMPPVNVPATLTGGDAAAGKAGYAICAACHGADGKGSKAMGGPALIYSSDWYLLSQLKNFKNGIRGADASVDPKGATMVPNALMLSEQAMLDVVAYIKTLK